MRIHSVRSLALSFAPALAAAAAAQSPVLPSGEPDPAFPTFYAWYDAGDGVNGAGQPAAGAPLALWTDNTGRGHDLVRTDVDPARQPTFVPTAANGRPAVRFDGDDYVWADAAAEFGTVTSSRTIFAVVRVQSLTNGYVFDSSSVAGRNALLNGQTSDPDRWQLFSGAAPVTLGPPVPTSQWQVFACVLEPNGNELFIDSSQVAVGTSPLSPMAGLILGSRYTVSNFLDGEIAELLFYEERLDSFERKVIEIYLESKYLAGPVGASYCGPAIPNSSGFPGRISGFGSSAVASGDLMLTARDLPAGQFGYFLAGMTQGLFNPPGSSGFICLSGNIGRFNRVQEIIVGPTGDLAVDLAAIPVNPPASVQPGDTWNFQCWYRDAGTSNFTDGLTVSFL